MKFAFVFPGQGSQSVGMLNDLAASYPLVRETYERAGDAIKTHLWKIVSEGPAEELNKTINTQPAMLAASYASWQIWCQSTAQKPAIMAGHSFGEVSALTCASVMSFEDAVALARARGELMQGAVASGVGGMAAILGLQDDELEALCQQISAPDKVVEAVNYNAPGQVVVAGHSHAIDELLVTAKDKGAKRALKLPVSVPAHSSLMKTAAEQFATVLAGITMDLPTVPVIQNATLSTPVSVEELTMSLQLQLHNPVQWVKTVEMIVADDIHCLLELGPGKVLAGLNKRIDKSISSAGIFDNASLEAALKMVEE